MFQTLLRVHLFRKAVRNTPKCPPEEIRQGHKHKRAQKLTRLQRAQGANPPGDSAE